MEKTFLLTTPSVALSNNVRKNIKVLKNSKIPFTIKKDALTGQKFYCFEAKLFDTNKTIYVKMPKGIFNFYRNSLILSFSSDIEKNATALDFEEIQKLLIDKLGLPDDCNSFATTCYWNLKDYQLVHDIYEARMGYELQRIHINFKPKTNLFRTTNYTDFIEIKDLLTQNLICKELELLQYKKNKMALFFIARNDYREILFKAEKNNISIRKCIIEKSIDEYGRSLTRHIPLDKKINCSYSDLNELTNFAIQYITELLQ